LKKVFHLLCAFMLCLQLCGGHLGMLQVVAWSGMLVNYARTDGVAEAARKTFDGEHKCSLCHAIDDSRAAEQQQNDGSRAPAPEWSKFGKELAVFESCQAPARLDGTVVWQRIVSPDRLWSAEPAAPPSPPPRAC
jgi:hypothetical protein